MNKRELVSAVAQDTGMRKKEIEEVVSSIFQVIREELKAGGKVQIVGFGTFDVMERCARTGRNPSSGERLEIEAFKNPRFKASRAFKEMLNESASFPEDKEERYKEERGKISDEIG